MTPQKRDLLLKDSVSVLKRIRGEVNDRLDTGLISELEEVIEGLEQIQESANSSTDEDQRVIHLLGRGVALLGLLRALGNLFKGTS